MSNTDIDFMQFLMDVTFTPSYKRGNNCPYHLFTIPYQISEDDAAKLQEKLGYHPAGYGLHDFSATVNGSSWECYNTCD